MESLITAIERTFFVTNNTKSKNENKKKNSQKYSFVTKKKESNEDVLMTTDMTVYCPTYDKNGQLIEKPYSSISFKA